MGLLSGSFNSDTRKVDSRSYGSPPEGHVEVAVFKVYLGGI